MNKNIKDEFDSLINSQAPDLWDRIEASLPEKTDVKEQRNESEQVNVSEQTNESEQKSRLVKRKVYRKYAAYGTVGIAACLCIALVALNNTLKKSQQNMMTDSTASEEILFNEAAEDAVEGDFAAESEGDGVYNGAMADFLDTADYEDEAAKEEAAGDEAAGKTGPEAESRAEEAEYKSDSSAEIEDMGKESLLAEKTEENLQALQDKKADLLEQGYPVYQDTWIQIESISENVEDGKDVVIYHVTILEEMEYMEKETQLDLKTDELFHTRLAEGERYRVTFYDNKMPYDSSVHEYFLLEAE